MSKYLLATIAALALLASGCAMGFTYLRPGENSGLYEALFHDIISTFDEPQWIWVRGSVPIDYNGDGIDEEAVIATIQSGTERRPGPIESAFLLICRVSPTGERTAIARTRLFEGNPLANCPKPLNDLRLEKETTLTRARAQVVQDKVTFKETVVVYFWGDETPGNVWYAGYGNENGNLTKNMETSLWQNQPGIMVVNLDRSVEASPYGYQLVTGVAAIPSPILAKLDATRKPPMWGHVFARDADGHYRQADARFGKYYHEVESQWNQLYLQAVMFNLPPEDLAWFEYHLGMLNHYTGNKEMAARYLEKAAANAKDDRLLEGITQAQLLLNGEDPTDWTPTAMTPTN